MPIVYRVCARLVMVAVLSAASGLCPAASIYQTPEDFIRDVFGGQTSSSARLWIDKDLQAEARRILGHDYGALRVRYWAQAERTAWILEEIGKDQPITAGIVVNAGKIEQIRVLIFRETRGWEIRYPFFTDQFTGAVLGPDHGLDRHIDGISGATLSVRAMVKLAQLALLFHQHRQG